MTSLFCPSFGRSFCRGNEHNGLDPNMSNSGHHDCSTKAVFLCTAVKLQSCHMLAHWTQHAVSTFQSAFIGAIALVVLSSSFTWQEPWANLGRILALACATTEKHWCPLSTFACFGGRAFLGIPYSSPCVAKLNKSVWSETRMPSAIVGVVFHG